MNYHSKYRAILETEADRMALIEQDIYEILNRIPIQKGPTHLAYIKRRLDILRGQVKMYRTLLVRHIEHSHRMQT